MEIADLNQVVAIEQRCSQSPWSLKQFQQSLDDSEVLVGAGKIIGFSVVASILNDAEIHNVAVHPDHQGLGAGVAAAGPCYYPFARRYNPAAS